MGAKRFKLKVKEGNVAVRTDGFFPNAGMGPMRNRQDEIHQQMVDRQTPKQVS